MVIWLHLVSDVRLFWKLMWFSGFHLMHGLHINTIILHYIFLIRKVWYLIKTLLGVWSISYVIPDSNMMLIKAILVIAGITLASGKTVGKWDPGKFHFMLLSSLCNEFTIYVQCTYIVQILKSVLIQRYLKKRRGNSN